ncbi:MAG: PDZ domain-containing protein [Planctomycetales bacterium]|nr:PDZ domain-containing protein [Planctomycetales bacterium]
MSSPNRYYYALGMIALGAICGWGFDLYQRNQVDSNPLQFVRRPVSVQTRDDAELLGRLLDQIDNSWEVGKNHMLVRSAFRDVVADARKSTVRVLINGHQVAMGTIVDPDGYVLTKASEVVAKGDITCQLYSRGRKSARVVGVLPQHDLAMLKMQARNLQPVHWYTQAVPEVGSLLATPNLNYEPLAVGVVSLAPQEIANNGVLGIRVRNQDRGPMITDVVDESAADKAGIAEGDIVLRIDDRPINTSDELVSLINQRLPGEEVELFVRRQDEELSLVATLGRRADLDQENSNFQSFLGGELSFRRTGFQSVLQHDTFLLPEHCGGPLVDLEGRVVGINIARAERIASYALPASAIVPWIDGLKTGEYESLVVRQQRHSKTTRE